MGAAVSVADLPTFSRDLVILEFVLLATLSVKYLVTVLGNLKFIFLLVSQHNQHFIGVE